LSRAKVKSSAPPVSETRAIAPAHDYYRGMIVLRDMVVGCASPDAEPCNAQSVIPEAFEQLRAELATVANALSDEMSPDDAVRFRKTLRGLSARAGSLAEFSYDCLRVEFAAEYSTRVLANTAGEAS
jgi:hypothetical protein